MASFVYNEFKRGLASGEFDLHSAGDDIRIILVRGSTTCDTEYDVTNMTDFTTPDYYTGANHDSTGGHPLDGEAVTTVTGVSGYGKFDATDETLTSLGTDATGDCVAIILFKWVTNLAGSFPIAYIDVNDFNGSGGDVIIEWHTDGILKVGG
jgi:hypothetical protein